ncbi:MAG TPA: tetratricopeptide repeat-containing diguanylate cyclase [Actinoplanes sp.]|nr:tetratricopeptide repeat-containing diguanylate cyclase [Actinoplanes sp.]
MTSDIAARLKPKTPSAADAVSPAGPGVSAQPGISAQPGGSGQAGPGWSELLDEANRARRSGDYRVGADLARRAATLAAGAGDRTGRARALRSLARQLLRLGESEPAIAACREAVDLLEAAHDEVGVCETLTVLAMAYNRLDLHEEALGALGRAREIAQRLGDRILLYWVHNRTGCVHGGMGDYRQGAEFLMSAVSMVDGMDDDARFCVFNNIGDNAVHRVPQLRDAGDHSAADAALAQALTYADSALALARAARHPYQQSISLDNYGMLLALAGEFTGAFAMFGESRGIAITHGYRHLESSGLQHEAEVRLMLGEYVPAVEGLHAALERAAADGGRPMTIHRELSTAYELVGDFEAALRHYRRFHELEREARNEVAATRARMMIHHFELDNARLEADNARLETELHRMRSMELEADKLILQREAVELGRRAHEDALTGLANRRLAQLRLPELMAAAAEGGRPLCLAVADVDHFKAVNDRFGHPLGDEVLRRVAATLRATVPAGDLIARFGGEEFLIAFDGLSLPQAAALCERIRSAVAGYPWATIRPALAVTISIGTVERTAGAPDTVLIAQADKQLYAAKHNGRNRVEHPQRKNR